LERAKDVLQEQRASIRFTDPSKDHEVIRYHAAICGSIEAYEKILNWDEYVIEDARRQQEQKMQNDPQQPALFSEPQDSSELF
jgi:hypothetical protein